MPSSPHPAPSVTELAPLAIRQKLDGGQPLTLLDVREPRERDFCRIAVPPAAADLHIPMSEVPARLQELLDARHDGPLVVYCHHGVRSLAVAAWLIRQGVEDVCNLEGGIDAWSVVADPRVPRYL